MNAGNRWQRLKAIFLEALEQPVPARYAWLADTYGDDEMYSEVRALLDAHESDPGFLEQPAQVAPEDVAAADPAGSRLPPGTVLGDARYRIIGEAGHGGMAVVYIAEDLRLPRRVALKSLPIGASSDPARLERFRREAWAAARISHPSIATIYAFEELDGHPFIAYELVRGRTLRAALRDGPLPPERARRVAIDIARGLAAAHEQGIVHRDLKPENVMLTDDGAVKVLDLGIAQIEPGDLPALTQEGSWIGTPAYMAPEQKTGGPVDARADIYSFGIVLMEMLTGHHPLIASSSWPSPGRGSGGSPSAAATSDTPASEGTGPFKRVVQRCVQLEPAARYGSARELLRDLEATAQPAAGDAPSSSARWWWEFHQVAMAVLYTLLVVAAWEAWNEIHDVFTDQTIGRRIATTFVVAVVAPSIVAATLRLNLWFTSRLLPDHLAEVRSRRRAWIRGSDAVLLLALMSGALLIFEASSNRSVVFFAGAIGLAVAAVLIEPVTTRAAFGSGTARQG